ncbi:hypothetical protein MBOVJF4428_00145 [Mycoplasmopsis agalactiae]|uniref:Uncharacterized protein n=1 Tax=Mycoplasmopsis agalactiae (strain NCTC 10123 / CIP 59.7 / PG2) TaxID=347257 RepID=A5IYR3_MYCAP|nr:hypothetical protein [Mycoplasmopsis agalactiae]MCE6057212.1 hypothetical protein [Mycoplasmopsis agalactiae]MCE6078998.1 hypothetical protein [Mycoplasmopsis agalactiae]MCE6095384.1 hypothetical protein [Mycoplasmopsis agalactiae]MCE6114641.1 hypothetical protein [Mycoplasmopsis agalactiae]NLS34519.1 hypothetical protein [Mycoplasmopsis agalactiae]
MNRKLVNSFIAGGLSISLVFASAQCGKLNEFKSEDAAKFNKGFRNKAIAKINSIFDKEKHAYSLSQMLKFEDDTNKWIFGNDKVDFEIKSEISNVFILNSESLNEFKKKNIKEPKNIDKKKLAKLEKKAQDEHKKEVKAFDKEFSIVKLVILENIFKIFEQKFNEISKNEAKQKAHAKQIKKLDDAIKELKANLKGEGDKVSAYEKILTSENWGSLLTLIKA